MSRIGGECQVCHQSESKYKCPGCDVLTCSLVCTNQHKESSECLGKRDKTKFIPIDRYSVNDFMSDYYFLEDIGRVADNAERYKIDNRVSSKHEEDANKGMKRLLAKEMKSRGIVLKYLSTGLQKSRWNRTFYVKKLKSISWTLELLFPHEKCSVHVHRVLENESINGLFKSIFKSSSPHKPIKQKLTESNITSIENYHVYMKKNDARANENVYYKMEKESSIRNLLNGKFIYEFPTFVFYPSDMKNEIKVMDNHEVCGETGFVVDGVSGHNFLEEPASQQIYKDSSSDQLIVKENITGQMVGSHDHEENHGQELKEEQVTLKSISDALKTDWKVVKKASQ